MAYATVEQVRTLCPHLYNLPNAPTVPETQEWIDEGAAVIDAMLESAGYSTPVGTSAGAYELLRMANRFYAAAMAEYSRLVATGREGNTRAEILEERFDKRMEKVLKLDLSQVGVSHSASVYIGGISESEKESVEADTDRIMPAIRRGIHAYPGAGTTSARVPSDPQERSD